MKRIVVVLLVVMAFALSGCDGEGEAAPIVKAPEALVIPEPLQVAPTVVPTEEATSPFSMSGSESDVEILIRWHMPAFTDANKHTVIYEVGWGIRSSPDGWFRYAFKERSSEDERCTWLTGDKPVLVTESGYEYIALRDWNMVCGWRVTPSLPPNTTVNLVGRTYDDVMDFGWAHFEFSESEVPENVIFFYDEGWDIDPVTANPMTTRSFGRKFVQVELEEIPQALPKRSYVPGGTINQAGEEIPVGEMAVVVIESPGTDPDGRLPVTLKIKGAFPGKPVTLYTMLTYLYSDAGTITQLGYPYVEWHLNSAPTYTRELWPDQVWETTAEFANPYQEKIWIIGYIGFWSENKDRVDQIHFVVELP